MRPSDLRVYFQDRDTILITHNGGDGIFFADVRRYVDEDSAIIVMTNAADRFTDEHLRAIRRLLFGTPPGGN